MKIIWLIIALVMSIFASNSVFSGQNYEDKRQTVHRAIKQGITAIQKKYALQLAGISEATDYYNEEKYKKVGLILSSKKYLSKDEGRKILLDVAHILLEHLNQDEVKPHLTVNPFTLDNISILICFQIRDKERDYSQFQACGNCLGKLYYTYDIPNQMGKSRDEDEAYEEALKLNEEVGDITTPISISLTNPEKPKKRSWWSSLFG